MGKQRQLKRQRALLRAAATSPEERLRQKTFFTPTGQPFLHQEDPSRVWEPMQRVGPFHFPQLAADWQDGFVWRNAWYECLVRYYPQGFPIDDSAYMVLGITHASQEARHDWRDYQRIKNDICGPEWEGLELYPSESRLVDPSNRFYLWCVPPGVIRWGLAPEGRRVWDLPEAIAPQRPFPQEA